MGKAKERSHQLMLNLFVEFIEIPLIALGIGVREKVIYVTFDEIFVKNARKNC